MTGPTTLADDAGAASGAQRALVSHRVHQHLHDAILTGRLQPGDALPGERKLAEELGANRHAVREALKRLQQAGLVRTAQGGASRVTDWQHEGGLDVLLGAGDVPESARRDVLEMRATIGADAARRCAQRAPAALRAQVLAHAEALAATDDPDARNRAYIPLWDALVDGSGNVAYRLALNSMTQGQSALSFEDPATVAGELGDPAAIRALAEAVLAGDADRAHALARDLLERSVPA